MGAYGFEGEFSKNLDYDDFVESQSVLMPVACASYIEDEDTTNQLLLAASQVVEWL